MSDSLRPHGLVAYQAPPSMGFSRQEYWSGLPFASPGDLPNPGIEPKSPPFQADALTSEPLIIVLSSSWINPLIKIAGRNINKLRYTNDTTLMAECEEELRSLLIK